MIRLLKTNISRIVAAQQPRWLIRVGLSLWFALLLLTVAPVHASVQGSDPGQTPKGVRVLGVSQEDLDKDGRLDVTVILCNIVTPNDRVLVFDGGGNMRASSRWEEATDFTDDTWIFDIGGTGGNTRATLVIAFSTDKGDSVARIYDHSTTKNGIRFGIFGRSASIIDPPYPSLTIRAKGGRWLNDNGELNYNLEWDFDGPATFRELASRQPSWFPLDGAQDWEAKVSDADHDGIPEYYWATLLAPVPSTEGFSRSGAQVNSGRHRPAALKNVIFWPLLNVPDNPSTQNYFDTPIFLNVDWTSGLVRSFAFQGYPIEEGYHVNAHRPLERGRVNVVDFENEMTYYDLAADRDGRPELFIRFVYTPPDDPHYVAGGPTKQPMEMVQYSWNQLNHSALLWDYKVDVAGLHPITQTVSLGDMVLQQIPHDELPRWIWERPWGFATLVAYESGDVYLSTEGLYDWSTLEGVRDYTKSAIQDILGTDQPQRQYLTGRSVMSPEYLYDMIRVGFRGEYADINGPVSLYFSPIDSRMHLLGASRGVYNLDNTRRIEYRNLDGDAYIDTWRFYQGTELLSQLMHTRDYLIYGGKGEVKLRQVHVPNERFRAQPPANHKDWVQLGRELERNRSNIAPSELEQLLRQFGGPELQLSKASIEGYRPTGADGFRFVLNLQPGFQLQGVDLLKVSGLKPGKYVITYRGGSGTFALEPLTPPILSATVLPAILTKLEAGSLEVMMHNDGLQDVSEAVLELVAVSPDGTLTQVLTQTISLFAKSPLTVSLNWAAPQAGSWTVTPQIRQADGRLTVFQPAEVSVSSIPASSPERLVEATTSPVPLILAVVALLSFAVIAGLTVWKQWSTAKKGPTNDTVKNS